MKAQDYFDKYIREEIKRCKCGCGTETQWHQSHSSYNDYITGHNEAGFKVKQPIMTQARREKMKQTAIETYAKLGDEYKKKISDGVKKSFQKEEVKKKHSDSIKAHWAIPANKKRLCEIRQRVWNEQHDDLVKKIFTPEFGEKISKANSERDVKKVSNAEIAFGNFISNIFGSDAVKRSVWEKVADKHRCFDFRVNTDNGTYTIEFDGHYWHGLDRKAMWNPIQLRNIAADQVKNAHCIANDLKLIRISETADLSTVTDITSLIAAAYHYSNGHETIKSRPRPFSAGTLFSKDESQSTPDDVKESVILPALMSLCVDEIELHGDTWLSRYERNESLSEALSELRSPSLAFNSSAGSSYLRNIVQSYWMTEGGFNESSCDLKKLDSVLRYRLGLGKTREIFDISAEEIKRGFTVQHAAPSWFKPAWAVHIWKELVGEITSPTVWDPSGGWGARMLGFTAVYPEGTYHCTEPATATYRDLVTLQDILRPGDSTHVYHQGSEHKCDQIEDESCDAIFTSPPYFDRERWWNEPGQCWRDYPTLESWESEYVIPTVANALMKLKQGGMFAINTTPEFSESWLSAARAMGFKFLYERELSSSSSHFQRAQGKKTRKNPEMLYVWTRITLGTIMKKAWLLPPKEDWIVDRFCQEWHSDNPDMSTLNPQECDVVWLIADWCWRQVPEAFLRSKRVLTTVHHIVPEKMTRASYDDFEARDRFTHAYHVPNIHTAQQVRAIVGKSKPVYVIPYWCNPRIWYPENRAEMRQKHGVPETAYVLGSFQRDTEGNDLRSPKLEKGPDLVADYIEGLKRTDTFVVLAGWRRQYIISRFESAGIKYKYFEKPSQSTLRELYATLDLYPVGARYEGGPQALTECGLMGIPCISRPVGVAEAVLSAESIAHDLRDTKPSVPSVSDMTIPYGYRAFRQMISHV